MRYTLALTAHAYNALMMHLLRDRNREQMAIALCGVNRLRGELRLLVRETILLPPEAFVCQTAHRIELKRDVEQTLHRRAYQQGLVQVDWHSHPKSNSAVAFSRTDDAYELALASYLADRMDGVPFGSVVVNDHSVRARLWITRHAQGQPPRKGRALISEPYPIEALRVDNLKQIPAHDRQSILTYVSPIHDRQVRAFGQELQRRLGNLTIGIVGLGGLGGALVGHLARLGVRRWVLVDSDHVEISNINRLTTATVRDAQRHRPKVAVARRAIKRVHPRAYVRALQCSLYAPQALQALKACDLLIVATDNHASRQMLNRLSVQYLIPLVHVGFNISIDSVISEQDGQGTDDVAQPYHITDVSGEYAVPDPGRWCLQCAGFFDPQQASWEIAPTWQRKMLDKSGYVKDTPAPAVGHLDGLIAALAAAEIHNLIYPYKPLQRYLVYDALRSELVPLKVTHSEGCLVCDAKRGVFGLGDLEPLPDYGRQPSIPKWGEFSGTTAIKDAAKQQIIVT